MNQATINSKSLILMFKLSSLIYTTNKSHILNNLIVIELMAVACSMAAMLTLNYLVMEFYMILFMLILLITESILGLSILINIIRTHSNDYLKSSTIVKC